RVSTEPFFLTSAHRSAVQDAVNRSHERHWLEGSTASLDGLPSLHFRIPDAVDIDDLDANRIAMLAWAWGNAFGKSITHTLMLHGFGAVSRVSVYDDDPIFDATKAGRFVMTYCRENSVVTSYLVDYTRHEEHLAYYRQCCSKANNAKPS